MKRLIEVFRLTNAEQRVIVLAILALLATAIFQKHREATMPRPSKQSSVAPSSPTAADAD